MKYTAGDYCIITATGQRALVLEVDEDALLLQPMTRNSKGYGRQVDLPQVFKRTSQVSPDTYGEKP